MPDPNQQMKWLEAMRRRSELMNEIYAQIGKMSGSASRSEIVDYVAGKLESTPVESEKVVLIGSLEIEFDDAGQVVDIRSDDGTSSFSVKPPAGDD